MRNLRTVWGLSFVLAVAIFCLAAGRAAAATSVVKDGANFFTADAVQKANADLQSLQQQYRHTVIVETFATPPAELSGKVDGDAASRNQAFDAFCDTHAFSLGADVYVLINKTPPHLQVWGRDNVQRSGLSSTGREGLTKELAAGFRAKDYDGALARMTAGLQRTFANAGSGPAAGTPQATPPANVPSNTPVPANTPYPTPAGGSSGGGGLLGGIGCIGLIVILVIVFIVIRLIRRLFEGGGSPPPGYGGGYGQGGPGYGGGSGGAGGGMGRGLFGGLLGGLFGSYLGNRTFGQGPSEPSGGGIFGGGSGGVDQSGGSSSGADFGPSGGDSSSGADFGGGGGGGGGGDAGGGGSSSGSDF